MKDLLLSYKTFKFMNKVVGGFSRLNFNSLTHFLMRLSADIIFRLRNGQRKESLEEIGEEWERMFSYPKKVIIKNRLTSNNTVHAKVIAPDCPLIGKGNVKACYHLMEYDRRLLEHIGGQLIVLKSRATNGVIACEVEIRKEGVSTANLVPAWKKEAGYDSRIQNRKLTTLWIILIVSMILAIALVSFMGSLDASGPWKQIQQILRLEFVLTETNAENLLTELNIDAFRKATYIDFAFIPTYTIFITSLWLLIIENKKNLVRSYYIYGTLFIISIILAGIFDIFENIFILKVLYGAKQPAQFLTTVFASLKFALFLPSLLIGLVTGLVIILTRLKSRLFY